MSLLVDGPRALDLLIRRIDIRKVREIELYKSVRGGNQK